MNPVINYFSEITCAAINQVGINEVLRRYSNGTLSFVFFFEEFNLFDALHSRIHNGYYLNIFQTDESGFCCQLSYSHSDEFETIIKNIYLNRKNNHSGK